MIRLIHGKKTKVLGGTYELRELLIPVIREGKRVYTSPEVMDLRAYCQKEQNTLWDESRRLVNPQKVYVDLSQKLFDLKKNLLEEMSEKRSIKKASYSPLTFHILKNEGDFYDY